MIPTVSRGKFKKSRNEELEQILDENLCVNWILQELGDSSHFLSPTEAGKDSRWVPNV